MLVNGVEVKVNGINDMSEQEIVNYINYVENETHESLKSLSLSDAEGENIAVTYELRAPKFERIRRITGYLVGTIDRWNNAKRSEEHDRVKHGLN